MSSIIKDQYQSPSFKRVTEDVKSNHKKNYSSIKKSINAIEMEQIMSMFNETNPQVEKYGSVHKKLFEMKEEDKRARSKSIQKRIHKQLFYASETRKSQQRQYQEMNLKYQNIVESNKEMGSNELIMMNLTNACSQIQFKYQQARYQNEQVNACLVEKINQSQKNLDILHPHYEHMTKTKNIKTKQIQIHKIKYQSLLKELEKVKKIELEKKDKLDQLKKQKEHSKHYIESLKQKVTPLSNSIGVLKSQVHRKIRCGWSVYNNLSQPIQSFDCADWNLKKRLLVTYNQIRIWMIGKLYPANKSFFKKFKRESRAIDALFHGNIQKCTVKDFQNLNHYVFQNDEQRIPYKLDHIKRYLAFGSQSRDLFTLYLKKIQNDLCGFQGYLLKIQKINVSKLEENSSFLNFQIHYTFDNKPYRKAFIFINLQGYITSSSIQALTQTFIRKKDNFSNLVSKILGNVRKGIIYLQIPKLHATSKSIQYKKIYDIMKAFK